MDSILSKGLDDFAALLDEQKPPLALFFSKTFLSTLGKDNPWWEYREPLHFSFEPMDVSAPTRPEEVASLYTAYHAQIGDALSKAEAEGKSLRLLIGESHANRNDPVCHLSVY